MLDLFVIFTTGGIVLWSYQGLMPVAGNAINTFIKTILLESRGGGQKFFTYEGHSLKWLISNELGLVFVAVVNKGILSQATYIDELLETIKKKFPAKMNKEGIDWNSQESLPEIASLFDEDFKKVYTKLEATSRDGKGKTMSSYENSKKAQKVQKSNMLIKEPTKDASSTKNSNKLEVEQFKERQQQIKFNKKNGGRNSGGNSPKIDGPKKKKEARTWGAGKGMAVKDLDFSRSGDEDSDRPEGSPVVDKDDRHIKSLVGSVKGQTMSTIENIDTDDIEDESDQSDDEDAGTDPVNANAFTSFFQGLVGNKVIDDEGIKSTIELFKNHLIDKNVASPIAEDICNGLAKDLIGTKMSTWKGLKAIVGESLSSSLTRILTPKRRIDILRDIMESKKRRRPFVITFCGVNGVGKSTNLAKICFWLLQNNINILIAACDTFRAGAVEQLRVHQRALTILNEGQSGSVELFQKGYGKDAANIALDAINYATNASIDVVLVDTAGRMQDNEPLMRSLAKLVRINEPDLVLFVGEALVGNEAVDQLTKFNQALANHSGGDKTSLIDGIILTKFDTIDDKVGAAISMTYSTGQPVVFVGTGQTYTDLKKLNVESVVKSLMH